MIKCPFCGTTHVANTLFCSECGTYLLEDDRRGTDPLGTDEIGWVGEGEEEPESSPVVKGTGPLAVRLRIGESGREVEASLNKAIHLGRLDPASDVFPEIDLTNDNGLERGVSRRHARILKREGTVVVEDLVRRLAGLPLRTDVVGVTDVGGGCGRRLGRRRSCGYPRS